MSAFEPNEIMAMVAPIQCNEGTIKATGVAQQRADFLRELGKASEHTVGERLLVRFDAGAYQIPLRSDKLE
jgi:hypothetical protein